MYPGGIALEMRAGIGAWKKWLKKSANLRPAWNSTRGPMLMLAPGQGFL
jgi:hypothetical protein